MLNSIARMNGRRISSTLLIIILALGFTSFLLVAPSALQPAHAEAITSWVKTTSYPSSPNDQSCVASDNYIYCVGGFTASANGGSLNSVYYAPLSSAGIGTWTRTTNYPSPVDSLSCVASGDYIYCVGGTDNFAPSSSVYFAHISSSGVGAWQGTTAYHSDQHRVVRSGSSGLHILYRWHQ
jgi:hypothetical protein